MASLLVGKEVRFFSEIVFFGGFSKPGIVGNESSHEGTLVGDAVGAGDFHH
jgi:hypothetical protein